MEPASVTIKKKRALRLAFSVVVSLHFSLSCGGPWCGLRSDDDRPVAQARGSADGRQEGRERGYYHLHRQLDDALLLHFLLTDRLFLSHTEITEITEIFRPSDSFIVLKFFLLSRRN